MEEDMFDTHLCLVCNQTILGLLNYVMHKRGQCHGKKSLGAQPEEPPPAAPQDYPSEGHAPTVPQSYPPKGPAPGAPQSYPSQGPPPVAPQSYPHEGPLPVGPQSYPSEGHAPVAPQSYPHEGPLPVGPQSYPHEGHAPAAPQSYPHEGPPPVAPQSYPHEGPPPVAPQSYPHEGNAPAAHQRYLPEGPAPVAPQSFPPEEPPAAAPQSYPPPLRSLSSHLQEPSQNVSVNHEQEHSIGSSSSMLPDFQQSHHGTYLESLPDGSENTFTSAASSGLPISVSNSQQYATFQSTTSQPGLFHNEHQMHTLPSSLSVTSPQDALIASIPSSIAAEALSTPVVSQSIQSAMTSSSLQDSEDANQNSCSSLSLDVHSSLSHFMSNNLSPIAGTAVNPNTVMSATTGTSEDFFQCLELKSKGAQEQKFQSVFTQHSKSFDDEDHADIDLPISKILSNLDFSSDEDMVDLPSDDDVDCDFDVYSDGDFEGPPKSHTGGKWKPGEGPWRVKKLKWRLGAGPIRHGGKWKPGMAHGKHGHPSKPRQLPASKGKHQAPSSGKQSEGKVYECNVCDIKFENRFTYSNHCGLKPHKEKVAVANPKPKTATCDKENRVDEKCATESCETSERKCMLKKRKGVHIHVCTVCDMKFNRKYEVAKHLVSKYHRNRCFNSPEAINMLQKYHHLVLRLSPFQCQLCRFYFNRKPDFLVHIGSQMHMSQCEQAVGQLLCVGCRFLTSSCDELEEHLVSQEHNEQQKKCSSLCIVREHLHAMNCKYCGISVPSKERMKSHVLYRHHQKKIAAPYVRTKGGNHPECPECGKTCPSPSALLIHTRRNHTKERPYQCKPCGKSFSVAGALSNHIKCQKHENKLKQDATLQVLDKAMRVTLQEETKNKSLKSMDGDGGNEDVLCKDTEMTEDVLKKDTEMTDGNEKEHVVVDVRSDPVDGNEKTSDMKVNKLVGNRKRYKNVFKCEHCNFECCEYNSLKPHCELAHPGEITQCDLCSSTFLSQKAYRIHCSGRYHQANMEASTEKMSEAFHKCSFCDMKFMDEKWRNFHVEFQHNHLNNEAALHEINQGNDKVSQLYGDHLLLLKDLPKWMTLACPECGKFLMKEYLVEHLRLHTGEKPYRCRFCDKCFVSKMSLRRHLMVHMGLTEKTCNICGREFKKLATYKNHMEQHLNEKSGNKCICDICGMVFLLQKQVEIHRRRHGERKFKCPIDKCMWTFVLNHELKMHMLTHTQEKKFLCDICGFAATTANRLQRHVKTHSGVRDYHCLYCPYKAGNSTHLRRHMRIHMGSKPYKCPYCPYTCNTHENIRKHIVKTKKHQGLKVYPCKICDFATNVSSEFRDHFLTCHPDEVTGNKLDTLSVMCGLYVRGEDPVEPREGTRIYPVKERQPKIQRNATIGNPKITRIRQNRRSEDMQGASAAMPEGVGHVSSRQFENRPVCSDEAYWPNSDNRNNWLSSNHAVNTLSTLTSDPAQHSMQSAPTSDGRFLMPQGTTNTTTSYHDGTVSNVVVVASDY